VNWENQLQRILPTGITRLELNNSGHQFTEACLAVCSTRKHLKHLAFDGRYSVEIKKELYCLQSLRYLEIIGPRTAIIDGFMQSTNRLQGVALYLSQQMPNRDFLLQVMSSQPRLEVLVLRNVPIMSILNTCNIIGQGLESCNREADHFRLSVICKRQRSRVPLFLNYPCMLQSLVTACQRMNKDFMIALSFDEWDNVKASQFDTENFAQKNDIDFCWLIDGRKIVLKNQGCSINGHQQTLFPFETQNVPYFRRVCYSGR